MPKWLKGQLFRNGPGASKVDDKEFGHLFDNFGLIHCFKMADGKVSYQCRFVNSEYYKKIQSKRVLITDFGTKSTTDPCNTIFHRVKSLFTPSNTTSDNAMISIYPFSDEMYAFGESPIIHRINKRTLETEERRDVYKHVGVVNHSAHPHIDSEGSVFNVGISYSNFGDKFKPTHNIVKFPINRNVNEMFANAHVVASIPARKFLNPSYMHSFGITSNYFVIVQQPLTISIPAFIKGKLLNEPLINALKWTKHEKTQIDVISRKTGKLFKSFHTHSLFFLHIINQYEQDDKIIIDICCYEDPEMINCMYTEALKNMQSNANYAKLFHGRPKRFILDLNTATTDIEGSILCNLGCETPQINYAKYSGRPYRYFYAINSDVDARYPGTVIKVNVEDGSSLTWCEDNCYPSEPIFVPWNGINTNNEKTKQKYLENVEEEDFGVLLASMVWGKNDTNRIGLLVLNAQNMKELCRWVFVTPSEVPKCLHGWFLPGKRSICDDSNNSKHSKCREVKRKRVD